jgi:hypothetical protein
MPLPRTKTKWVKLKRGNDWGRDYWAIKPLDERGYASASRGIRLTEAEPVRVRLKNGLDYGGVVRLNNYQAEVHDHGHSYLVTTVNPQVELKIEGTPVRVQFADCEFPLAWVKEREPR